MGIYTKIGGGYRITFPIKGDRGNIYHAINRDTTDAIIELIEEKIDELIMKMNSPE